MYKNLTYTWSFWHAFLKGQVRVWKAITNMPLHCSCPPATHPCVCCIIYLTGRYCLLPCLFPVVIFSSFRPVSRWVLTALICETIGEHCTPWRGANYCHKDFCSRYFNSCFLLPSSGSKWRAPLSRTPQHILGKSVKAETWCCCTPFGLHRSFNYDTEVCASVYLHWVAPECQR